MAEGFNGIIAQLERQKQQSTGHSRHCAMSMELKRPPLRRILRERRGAQYFIGFLGGLPDQRLSILPRLWTGGKGEGCRQWRAFCLGGISTASVPALSG
jgi:hypothetical protein